MGDAQAPITELRFTREVHPLELTAPGGWRAPSVPGDGTTPTMRIQPVEPLKEDLGGEGKRNKLRRNNSQAFGRDTGRAEWKRRDGIELTSSPARCSVIQLVVVWFQSPYFIPN